MIDINGATKKRARKRNWIIAKTEHWDHIGQVKRDLFGFIDFIAISDESIIGIQSTSRTNMRARLTKIQSQPQQATAMAWLRAGGILLVWGWDQPGAVGSRYQLREVELRLDQHGELIEWELS